MALEGNRFQQVIDILEPHADELDDAHLVQLALALESMDREGDALKYLESRPGLGTDARGVLAGRLKRRWSLEGRRADAEDALRLYDEALQDAVAAGDDEQVGYHAINVAFMRLAYHKDLAEARRAADLALEYCQRSPVGYWRAATAGEAMLYRGEFDEALTAYRRAISLDPGAREAETTFRQAFAVVGQLENSDMQRRLDTLFRPEVPGEPII